MNEIAELLKVAGFPGLVFLIWYLYHQSETAKWQNARVDDAKKWESLLIQVKTDQESKIALLHEILSQSEKAREREFALLKDTIETMNFHSGQLARIEQKIDTNQFCPITRKERS
jgi:hypothetical protein